jgi:hypothetical protein
VQHAGKVLTHRLLLHELWGENQDPSYLRVYVRQLRQKIEIDPEVSAIRVDGKRRWLSLEGKRIDAIVKRSKGSVGVGAPVNNNQDRIRGDDYTAPRGGIH